jgi:hypothetical protein
MELFIGGAVGVLVVMLVIGLGVLFLRDRIAPIEPVGDDNVPSSETSENV